MNIWEIISIVSLVLLFVVYVQLQDIKSSIRYLLHKEKKVSADQEKEGIEFPEKSEVIIAAQVWMTKNLEVVVFRNGDPIPQAASDVAWELAGENKQPAWCYNGEHYGKLYNWYAVNDPRGLAPEGWHIPTDQEWTALEKALGENPGKKMKSTWGWHNKGNGTNSSGFSGLPGGSRGDSGAFYSIGEVGDWWSATEYGKDKAWYRHLSYSIDDVYSHWNYSKAGGLSVRCVKD
jgi:uncharacterized protein (TIGR02145 family)